MRINIVLGPFFPVPTVLGGAVEKAHLLLAPLYVAAGHQVAMISRRYGDFAADEVVSGVRHRRVTSFDRSPSMALNLPKDLIYSLRVAAMLPAADVTVTNSFFLPLVLPHRKAGKIYVQVGRYPKRQMGLYGRADRIQAVSHAVAEAIVEQTPGAAKKVVTIGYAIPDIYFDGSGKSRRRKTIVFVGRLAREKGLDLLLKAFARLQREASLPSLEEWTLRIVGPHETSQGGDGEEYLHELKTLAADIGPACEFVGPVFNQQSLAAEYHDATVFVYPSRAETGEALPLAPLEAMGAGCAAVVSKLRCFDDYIENGVSGLIFDHRSGQPEVELAAALRRLIEDPALAERIAAAGNRNAQNFSAQVIAEKMLDDFRAIVAGDQSTA